MNRLTSYSFSNGHVSNFFSKDDSDLIMRSGAEKGLLNDDAK